MERKLTLSELIKTLIRETERLKYSMSLVRHLKKDCRRFFEYVIETTGSDVFTEEIGAKYLAEKFGYPTHYSGKLPAEVCGVVRCVRRLGEYQLFGAFTRQWSRKDDADWYLTDEEVITAYLNSAQTADNRESTKVLRIYQLKKFYEFLAFRNCNGITDVSAQLISDYAMSLHGFALTTSQQLLAGLKNYLRFLYRNRDCSKDWSFCVPKVNSPQNLTIPALWKQGEIEFLLKSIDRSSPVGKRDYAVILLAVQLGLRSSDIAELKLDSLKWERNEIELIQYKTSGRIIHPLLKDVGWAIIDYIKYARPAIDTKFVFLSANAPYGKIEAYSVSSILKRHMRLCGIVKPAGVTKGAHSLRHAFARRLLEQGTPLPEVAEIMGHVSYSSTSPYLKVDIDGLRSCALSLSEVMNFA